MALLSGISMVPDRMAVIPQEFIKQVKKGLNKRGMETAAEKAALFPCLFWKGWRIWIIKKRAVSSVC